MVKCVVRKLVGLFAKFFGWEVGRVGLGWGVMNVGLVGWG